MGLYVGTSLTSYAEICRSISEEKVRNLMQEIVFKIGELKFCLNPSLPSHGNLLDSSQIPDSFKGWAYCKGDLISKELFPKAYEVLNSTTDYPGKKVTQVSISLPSFNRFFRLNPGTNKSNVFQTQAENCSTPKHVHKVGTGDTQIQDSGLIENAAFFWGTAVGKNPSTAGRMPSQRIQVIENGKEYDIPISPSGHYGARSKRKVMTWDIPVDAVWNSGNTIRLNGNTGNASLSNICQPKNVECAMMIFIGYPKNWR